MTQEDSQTETGEGLLAPLIYYRELQNRPEPKAETFLELLPSAGAQSQYPKRVSGWLGARFWHFIQHADSNSKVQRS